MMLIKMAALLNSELFRFSSLSELKSRLQGGLSDGVAGWELGNSEWNTLYILKDMFRTADYSLIIR